MTRFRRLADQKTPPPTPLELAAQVAPSQQLAAPGTGAKTSAYVKSQRAGRRSEDLLDVMRRLDAQADPEVQKQLIAWIQNHYEERGGGELIGLFAKCHLGDPFIDHHLAISHQILHHFTADDAIPAVFAPARSLVRSPVYLFVEVYSDGAVIPVRTDGGPVV